MDNFSKTTFRQRSAHNDTLPEVSRERIAARALAADRFKSQMPPEMRRCEACGWRPPWPLLKRNKRLSLLHAHHVIAVYRGGSDEPENLILLCGRCHGIADYLGGRIALATPIKTREQLIDHLTLLLNDPDAWDQREIERGWEIQGRVSGYLEQLLSGEVDIP